MARPQVIVYLSTNDPYSDLTTNTWYNISNYVLLDDAPMGAAIQISRGRQSEQDTVQAGTCSLVLNNSDSRFSIGSTTYGNPIGMTHKIRISTLWAGVERAIFTGFTQEWNPDGTNGFAVVQVKCVDAFGLFARDEVTVNITAGTTTAALTQVLTAMSFPTANTWMPSNPVGTVLPASYTDTNALQLLQSIAAVEDGTFFIEYDGFPTLHARYYRIQVQSSPFRTFSDLSATGYPYVDADLRLDDQFLYNDIRVASETTGNTQQSLDGASLIRHRRRKLDKGSVPLGDVDCNALATWALYQYSSPMERFNSITLNGDLDNTLWPDIIRRLIDERVRIIKRVGSRTVQKDAWIAGIQHSIGRDVWLTKWMLIPADKGSAFFTLDSSTSGILDTNLLGY